MMRATLFFLLALAAAQEVSPCCKPRRDRWHAYDFEPIMTVTVDDGVRPAPPYCATGSDDDGISVTACVNTCYATRLNGLVEWAPCDVQPTAVCVRNVADPNLWSPYGALDECRAEMDDEEQQVTLVYIWSYRQARVRMVCDRSARGTPAVSLVNANASMVQMDVRHSSACGELSTLANALIVGAVLATNGIVILAICLVLRHRRRRRQ